MSNRAQPSNCLYGLRNGGLALVYALLAATALHFFTTDGYVPLFWPASGVALAGLLIGGPKYWPGIFGGALAAHLTEGMPLWAASILAGGNTLECLFGAWLLSRAGPFDSEFRQLRNYLRLCGVAAICALLGAIVGATTLGLSSLQWRGEIAQNLVRWWQGDMLGLILVAPLILVWQKAPRQWLGASRSLEAILCFGLAFLSGQIIFLGWLGPDIGVLARAFVMFIFISWSAVRFGRHGTLLVIGMVAVQALAGALLGLGYFATDLHQTGLTGYALYMLELAVVGMALAVFIDERVRAERALAVANLEQGRREGLLRQIMDTSSVAIFLVDENGRLAHANQRMAEMFGLPIERLSGLEYLALIHPSEMATTRHSLALLLAGETPAVDLDRHYQRADGRDFWGHLTGSRFNDSDGEARGFLGVIVDITRRRQAEEKMQLAALVYKTSSEAMMVTDANGTIIAVNPSFTRMTGYAAEEVIGKTPRILSSGRHDQAFYQAMWEKILSTGSWEGEIWDRRKNGEIYPKRLSINTTTSEDGTALRRIALFSDITEKKRSEEVIWRQANFDPLTGLANRRMFMDRLAQEIKTTNRAEQSLALMFLDLDRFKEINDTLGHDMGDLLLKDAAKRLAACVRESDTVARLGGDEFTIILGGLDRTSSVERIAEDILHKLAMPFHLGSEAVYLTTSIGITFCPEDAEDIEALIKNADQAMYAAKSQGRNRYSYFTAAMQGVARTRMRLTNDLRNALENKQFRVHYQPIVELASGAIHKAEALIRWQHPTRGLVSPADFIPLAEETGLIVTIGNWVFLEAVHQVEKWRAAYRDDFQISVNKSPVQFRNVGSSHGPWVDYLQQRGLPGQSIVVEITEGLLMEPGIAVSNHLLGFRDAGIQVSLDDFGTGYSSLSYLHKFDIDYLKIDQSFVRDLAPASHHLALCEAIIVMAHKLGIKVIAEGVETVVQRDLLAAVGCDYAQGYLYSRPVPPEEFERLVFLPAGGAAPE